MIHRNNLQLYRFPKLRPPTIDGKRFVGKCQIESYLIERLRAPILQPICFMKDIHEIPNVSFYFRSNQSQS